MLRLAIVGVGGYGAHHLKGFAALEAIGAVKIVAVADPSERALENARKVVPLARFHSDFIRLLDDDDFTAIVLATPIPLHEEMALAAIRQRRHILLEKPAVPLYSQWKTLVEADVDNRVAVAFQHISSPGLRIVRRMIEDGTLGSLQSLSVVAVWPRTTKYYERADWAGQLEWQSRPVLDGPATNGLAHYINDMMFLAGSQAGLFDRPDRLRGELHRARHIPSYDTALLQGALHSGPRFAAGFSHAGTEISQARLRVEGSGGVLWVEQDGSLQSDDFVFPSFSPNDGRDEMWRDFVEFASGRHARPGVLLRDVEGYTLATNLMFQSSGVIHTVPDQYVNSVAVENGSKVMELAEINALLQRSVDNFCPLSEAGAVWGRPGEWLASRSFSEEKMLAGLVAAKPAPDSAAFLVA